MFLKSACDFYMHKHQNSMLGVNTLNTTLRAIKIVLND